MNARAYAPCRLSKPRRESGLATLEFAICAPLLFLLMLGTAEFGRVLFQYNTLTKAVRDGARHAARRAEDSTGTVNVTPQIISETTNLIRTGNIVGTGPSLLPGALTVEVEDGDEGYIFVSATYSYSPMFGATLPTFGLGDDITLVVELPATVTMRAL